MILSRNIIVHLFLFIIGFVVVGHSQDVDIPDADFLQALIEEGVDQNNDGVIQVSEAEAVQELVFKNQDFQSLDGIDAFVKLGHFVCYNNSTLTEINFANFDELSSIELLENDELIAINLHVIDSTPGLSINVYSNPTLSQLSIQGHGADGRVQVFDNNMLEQVSLDLTGHLFEISIAQNPELTDLSFSEVDSVSWLVLAENDGVDNYNLSGIGWMDEILVSGYSATDILDLTTMPVCRVLEVRNSNIKSIELSSIHNIKWFISENNPRLEVLNNVNFRTLTNLRILGESNLDPIDLTGLDSLGALKVESSNLINMDLSMLPSLREIEIVDNPQLATLQFGVPNKMLENIQLVNNEMLGVVDYEHLIGLREFEMTNCGAVPSLTFHNLPKLFTVSISNNGSLSSISLERLDTLFKLNVLENDSVEDIVLSDLRKLKYLKVEGSSSLDSLHVSDLPALSAINCIENENLSFMAIERLPLLEYIRLNKSAVRELKFSNLDRFNHLNLSDNIHLTDINLSQLNALNTLYIQDSPDLIQLNVSELPHLEDLTFSGVGLSVLDLRPYPDLRNLHLTNCPLLENLYLSAPSTLEYVTITSLENLASVHFQSLNQLTDLRLTKLESLESVTFSSLELLEDINISRCPNLHYLDLSGLPGLGRARTYYTPITYLNVLGVPGNAIFRAFDHNISYVCAEFSQQDWLEQQIQLTNSTNSIVIDPTCTYSGNSVLKAVEVEARFSSSSDCDEMDPVVDNLKLNISSRDGNFNQTVLSRVNDSGYHKFYLPLNTFDIFPEFEIPYGFSFSPDTIQVIVDTTDVAINEKLCISPSIDSIHDITSRVLPLDIARPGFEVVHQLIITNNGNFSTSGGFSYIFDERYVQFVSADYEVAIGDGELFGTFEGLSPFQSIVININLHLNAPTDTPPLNMGDTLKFTQINFSEDTSAISFYHLREPVINSFDPNDKTCLQGQYLLDDMIGDYVTYRIRFENTGNGEAVNVRVIDAIDPDVFDISTLRVVKASHPVIAKIIDDEVAFVFDDIDLPFQDSINDGYVFFEVKTWDDLELETTLENTAEIYFDFNFPIKTNTTNTIVATDMDGDGFVHLEDCDDENAAINPDAEEIPNNGMDEDCDGEDFSSTIEVVSSVIHVFPNPFSEALFIETTDESEFQVNVFNAVGQMVLTARNTRSIATDALNAGSYVLEYVDLKDGGSILRKIVKVD